MPKKKNEKETVQSNFESYAYTDLVGILNTFDNSPAWNTISAFLRRKQRECEMNSMYEVANGMTHQSSYSSGYAKALDYVSNDLLQEMKKLAAGMTDAIENPRTEE